MQEVPLCFAPAGLFCIRCIAAALCNLLSFLNILYPEVHYVRQVILMAKEEKDRWGFGGFGFGWTWIIVIIIIIIIALCCCDP